MNLFLATKVRERFYALGPFRRKWKYRGHWRFRSLVMGGFLRLQQTLTSCVAPLEKFTRLRQPVKSGNSTLITISRTKLFMRPHGGEFSRRGPRGSTRTPFSRIFVSFYHRLRKRPRHFRIKQDTRRTRPRKESLMVFNNLDLELRWKSNREPAAIIIRIHARLIMTCELLNR